MATVPPLDLANLSTLEDNEISASNTRVLVQKDPTSSALNYVTIEQMANLLLRSTLTLSASGALPAPIDMATLQNGQILEFTIDSSKKNLSLIHI